MKKSLLALLALCMAVMLVLCSCSVSDLLAQVGFGEDTPADETPANNDPVNNDPQPVAEDPIEIPDPEGKADKNTYVLQFPLITLTDCGAIKAVQVEMNKTLTLRVYAAPSAPTNSLSDPPVITFTRANKTGVGYGTKNATSAEIGADVFCFEYVSVPVSVIGKDSTIVISLANTKNLAKGGTFCDVQNYTFDAYFDAVSAQSAELEEVVTLLETYSTALNNYIAGLTAVKTQDKKVVEDYYDAFVAYGNAYAKYQKGLTEEAPVAPALPPMPDVIPYETVNETIAAAVVEGFTVPDATKVFELTPETKNIDKLKNYIAGVYVDFTGTSPVLVFRLALANVNPDDDIEYDVRLNDYRITEKNLLKVVETPANSVDAETVLNNSIQSLISNADEFEQTVYYLVKTDALTFTTLDKEYTLTIYDEENNAIESLTYSALDYIRAFAAGRTISAEDLELLKAEREEVKDTGVSGTSGEIKYLKDAQGNFVLNEKGKEIIDYSGDTYQVEIETKVYEYPTEADTYLGELLIAWYNISQNAYLTK